MKKITPTGIMTTYAQKLLLILILTLLSNSIQAQNSSVEISVNWPNWSSENRAEIYDPSGVLIATIDNGFTGGINNSFSTTLDLGCLPNGTNYSVIMLDNFGDGWNGFSSNITIQSAGITVLSNSGNSASPTGVTLNFNVFGNDCNNTPNPENTEGPGGITTNIGLWLKADQGAGTNDGEAVSLWSDQANNNDATVNVPGQEPTYRDNPNFNVNFNPVVDFENNPSTAGLDFSYTDTDRNEMQGAAGYYSDDIYLVIIPDTNTTSTTPSMDIFCSDSNTSEQETDGTGIGLGRYSIRFENEVLAYAHGTTPNGSTPVNGRGYGVAQTSSIINYDNVGIINARHNNNNTRYQLLYNSENVVNTQVGVPQFGTIDNGKYWLGRSEGFNGSLDGRILEVISFTARNNQANRNKIESYLAIKYGITLGVNGVSQDYVDSNGTTIWDASANTGYNFDIAGIGRDDNSLLNQKQSRSVNNSAIVSLSLTNTELTNSLNTEEFTTNNNFLMWGNNGLDTNASASSIVVNLGPATVTTVTDMMNRSWKITETPSSNIGEVEVSVFDTDFAGLPPLVGNDAYVMIVANDENFTQDVKTIFMDPSSFNGLATREGLFDFHDTQYFTFGVAHEEIRTRHLGFDGVDNFTLIGDKLDLAGRFTVSAWVKPDGSNAANSNKTIVAKSNGIEGYKLFLTDNNKVSFAVGNTALDKIESNTTLPNNIWHHVAATYDGVTVKLYIDGILDNTSTMIASTANNSQFAIGALYVDNSNISNHFKGDLDEIRIWDEALSLNQLRYIMNQEIIRNGDKVNGVIIPNTITKNEIETVDWSNLLAYYSMNSYIGTHLNDVSGNGNRGSLANPDQFTLEFQSSPLPYKTATNGDWNNNTTWQNGTDQYIPGSASIVNPNITIDWNIVKTENNITLSNNNLPISNRDNRTLLALSIENAQLTVNGSNDTDTGNGLTITHYLNIDGKLDLQGESQLIQTVGSDFDANSSGTLERDQQGTQDLYTYNYWGSPVGTSNTISNNNEYTVATVLKDGTDPNNVIDINFTDLGFDGSNGSPITIADFWLFKYSNQSGSFYDWQQIRSTGTVLAGEGFTMKGVNNTEGNVALEQNYTFEGKPNNGDITLPITADNEYLVGNPYASALDANKFIIDNAATITGTGATNGTLYFWEHWGGGSHVTAEYQGGYATYNLSGAVPAAALGVNTLGSGGTPTKLPGRYIPVGQGFFVSGEATGHIVFNNGQRAFQKENGSSIFIKNNSNLTNNTTPEIDNRLKIRLGLNSVNTIRRQILITADENATVGMDYGYDAENVESQIDDMFWMIDDIKLSIQGINVINENTILPLGLHTSADGDNTFKIDALENVPEDLNIYLYDSETEVYHDLRAGHVTLNISAGDYFDRFELRFKNNEEVITLSIDDFEIEETGIQFYFENSSNSIVINNPELKFITFVKLYDITGQSVLEFNTIELQNFVKLKTNAIATGNYILEIITTDNRLSKKVLIE